MTSSSHVARSAGYTLCAAMIALAASCGGSPMGPTTPPAAPPPAPAPAPAPPPAPEPAPPPPPPPRVFVTGRVVDMASGNPQANLQVGVDGVGVGATNGSGEFSIEAPASFQDTTTLRIQGSSIVTRTSRVRVPGPPASLSTIPSGFDIVAFDQMYRHSGALTRWVQTPRLVVQTRVLQFSSSNSGSYTATSESMTDAQAMDVASTLIAALPALTGGRFNAFTSVIPESANPGASVSMMRTGDIVVAHLKGLTTGAGAVGRGSWSTDEQSIVRGGYIQLDRDYDISNAGRRATRAHELGHALGYNHVTARQSVMNSPSTVEPNTWDRDSSRVAFQREPGNRSPDNDPVWVTSNPSASGRIIWNQPVP